MKRVERGNHSCRYPVGVCVPIGVMCRKLINRPGSVGARLGASWCASLSLEQLRGGKDSLGKSTSHPLGYFMGYSVARVSMYSVRTLMMSLAVAALMQPREASAQEPADRSGLGRLEDRLQQTHGSFRGIRVRWSTEGWHPFRRSSVVHHDPRGRWVALRPGAGSVAEPRRGGQGLSAFDPDLARDRERRARRPPRERHLLSPV